MKKRSTAILLSLAMMAVTVVVVYAAISFISTETQTSRFIKKEYFKMTGNDFFVEDGEIGPSESRGIDPVITSMASVDMYVFIRVEIPVFDEAGLYSLNTDGSWTLIESEVVYGQWIEVYGYAEALAPEASTTAWANELTMVDMTLSEYAQITDMDVSMTGYGCKTVDEDGQAVEMYAAWELIKDAAGV